MSDDLLRAHLQNHWVAATTGTAFFARVARSHGLAEVRGEVGELAGEIVEDRESLRMLMAGVGVEPSTVGAVAGRAAELLGRLKPNGRIIRRSPLSDVLELEALRTAVAGKRSGWELLRRLAEEDPRLDAVLLDELLVRAERQAEALRLLHLRAAPTLLQD